MPPADSPRTTLLVPADERQSLARAKDRGAAAVVFDLADQCDPQAKADARGNAVDALAADGWGDVRRLVRVNDWSTHWTYRDVIEVVEGGGANLAALVLPRVRSAHDVAALDLIVTQIETTMGLAAGAIGIVAELDDAAGVLAAPTLAAASPRLSALVCNACEFASHVVLAARAAGLAVHCLAGDAAAIDRARTDGFDGVYLDDPALVAEAGRLLKGDE